MKTPTQIARQCSTRYGAGVWHCPATGERAGTADQHPVQARYVSPGYWEARSWSNTSAEWQKATGGSMKGAVEKLARRHAQHKQGDKP